MKIHKLRTNHATNSSSTHSLLFLDEGQKVGDDTEGSRFGCDFFTASSQKSKEAYFALQLYNAICRQVGDGIARAVVSDMVASDVSDVLEDGHIDHQSQIYFPREFGGTGVDIEFVKEYRDFLMRDDLVILGGNDNTGDYHHLDDGSAFNIPYNGFCQVGRKDGNGFWTLYNQASGSKVRMSFDSGKEVDPSWAQTPELIDVKITNWCGEGCSYCYQGSTKEGVHAEMNKISHLAYACKDLKVFEVAIGGGEPLAHPKFIDILKTFRSQDVVPNFSTRRTTWLESGGAKEILDTCGSWALSVDTAKTVRDVNSTCEGLSLKKPSIHAVVGAMNQRNFKQILETCKRSQMHVVLLGFKNVGRGENVTPDAYPWLDIVQEVCKNDRCDGWIRVSIDTKLIELSGVALEQAKVAGELLEKKEGAFSMYVDMVKRKFGPSSYCDESEMKPLESGWGSRDMASVIRDAMWRFNKSER